MTDHFDALRKRYPADWLPGTVKVHQVRDDLRWLMDACAGMAKMLGAIEKELMEIAPEYFNSKEYRESNPAEALLVLLREMKKEATREREPAKLIVVPRLDTNQIRRSIMEGHNAHKD